MTKFCFGLVLVFAGLFTSASEASDSIPQLKESGPYSFTEKEVEFKDGSNVLRGTLYLPDVQEKCPAVVLLGGAERGPRTPFKKMLAERFAAGGIAALIYDSPGTGRSTGNFLFQTKIDRRNEALAAHRFLKSRKGIHSEQAGIFGISEGAGVALLAAAEDDEVAFVFPVSGSLGVSPLEVSRYRIEMMGTDQGLSHEEIAKAQVLREILFALIAGTDIVEWPLIRMKVNQWSAEPWNDLIDSTMQCRQGLNLEQKIEAKARLKEIMDPWKTEAWFELALIEIKKYEQFMALDADLFFHYLEKGPFAAGDMYHYRRELNDFSKVQCPVLAIWGERDRFVPPGRSAALFGICMSETDNRDVTLMIVPGASHLISIPGERFAFAERYPQVMIDWVLSRFPAIR